MEVLETGTSPSGEEIKVVDPQSEIVAPEQDSVQRQ